MANLDRNEVIDLLGRLGAESDETVLHAARELNRKVGEAGITWDDLLRLDHDPDGAGSDNREPIEKATAGEPAAEADIEQPTGGKAEVARLIDRLLARQTISDTLREDLIALKRAIAEGTFEEMDARYVRALAKRLGV